MSKYRKKPVEIEAIQFTGDNFGEVLAFTGDAARKESAACFGDGPPYWLRIDTLEGSMVAGRDDWIIRGVQGEFYPIKDAIFRETYAPVDDEHVESWEQVDNQRNLWAKQCHEAEAERAELAERLSILLCELTGGRMSKTNYDVPTMVSEVERTADDDLRDAIAERDQLRRQVEAVKVIHKPHVCTGFPNCMTVFGGQCAYEGDCDQCRTPYPCATLRALDGAEGGADRG